MTNDKKTIGDIVAERMRREATSLDDAVAALMRAGAKLEHIVIQHWPQGMGDDPTPRTTVAVSPPVVLHWPSMEAREGLSAQMQQLAMAQYGIQSGGNLAGSYQQALGSLSSIGKPETTE